MAARDKDGHSLRETLQGLLERARSGGKRAELEEQLWVPPRPEALDYLWSIYFRIRRRCSSTGLGPARITWPDIDAFVRNSGVRMAPWEIRLIEDLDDAWLSSQSS
ncbi:hypothetical protein AKG11_03610 [Shinella sp. SUS2]|nr:hypothetical protein AKG11_03610 [Shinella sp. SUS2]KOC77426.1 hypothetical protein AKG10_01080 [Shinella sp. GWS1]